MAALLERDSHTQPCQQKCVCVCVCGSERERPCLCSYCVSVADWPVCMRESSYLYASVCACSYIFWCVCVSPPPFLLSKLIGRSLTARVLCGSSSRADL